MDAEDDEVETVPNFASISSGLTRKERLAFEDAVADVMRQTKRIKDWRTDFMPCHADPFTGKNWHKL